MAAQRYHHHQPLSGGVGDGFTAGVPGVAAGGQGAEAGGEFEAARRIGAAEGG